MSHDTTSRTTTSHDRSTTIETILAKRQQQAARLNRIQPDWEKLKESLEKLDYYWQTTAPALSDLPAEIEFSSTLRQIQQELQTLTRLSKRLGRDRLNIGVLGEMGQGKSQLLRGITSAAEAVIPTSDDDVCTSAISKIYHEPTLAGVKAEIDFYTWESFRDEVISLYYTKLEIAAPVPQTANDFKHTPFPRLPEQFKDDENAKRLYGNFRKDYYEHFDQYRSQLGQPMLTLTNPDEIRQYVTHSSRNSQLDRLSYDNIPVREARIFCSFSDQEEVGKIGLIDLPGTGDNSIYDAARLIKAVEQEVDFILFVRKVESKIFRPWNDGERNLITTTQRALIDLPLSQCSLVVLNRFRTKDADEDARRLEICHRLQQTTRQEGIVQQAVVVDCTDAAAVKQGVLDPVLDYLVEQIDRLYETALNHCDRRLQQLQQDIQQKLEIARTILVQQSNEDNAFQPWFEGNFWLNLTTGLQAEQIKLWGTQNLENKDFKAKVQEVIQNCQAVAVIPSIDEIVKKSAIERSYKMVYYQSLLLMRKQLAAYFGELGFAIEQLLDQVRSAVAEVLAEQAGLKTLSPDRGAAFLQAMAGQIPTRHRGLKNGFEKIIDFKASYENPEKWVESALAELDPDRNLDPLSQEQIEPRFLRRIAQFWDGLSDEDKLTLCQGAIGLLQQAIQPTLVGDQSLQFAGFVLTQVLNAFGQSRSSPPDSQHSTSPSEAEQIQRALTDRRDQVVTQCAEILNGKLTEPHKTAYSMFIRFVDQILTENPTNQSEDVKLQWRLFLETKKDVLLDSSEAVKRAQIRQQLQQYVTSAIEANQPERLQFY